MEQATSSQIANIEEIKKLVMQESLNGSRLTTLRLPRDLTLGGTKSKRVFTPNLNVVRNKDKSKGTNESFKSEQHKRRLPNSALKRVHKRPNLLQSEGIFSQGIGDGRRPNFNSERTSIFKGRSTNAETLTLPTISKTWQNIDKDDEKVLLERLLADQDSDSGTDSDDFSSVILPLEFPNSIQQSRLPDIKKETSDDNNQHQMTKHNITLDIKPIIKAEYPNSNIAPFISCLYSSKLYNDDEPAFAFVKLPNSFPGKVWKDTTDDSNSDYKLKDMQDGAIGKIIVRKSGKMELSVKNTKYLLTADSAGSSINTAVLFPGEESISMDPSLVTLGGIGEIISVSPDWDILFERAKKNPKFYY